MINSAEQLKKYKTILATLKKRYPKEKTNWEGFTIDISYGGNKEPDIKRVCIGSIASEKEVGDEFLKLLIKTTEDQIDFWQKSVLRDIKELEESLK